MFPELIKDQVYRFYVKLALVFDIDGNFVQMNDDKDSFRAKILLI